MGRRGGLSDRHLLEWREYLISDAFDEIDRLVIAFSLAMTATPAAVSDDLFQKLRARLTERQMVELASVVAWENYRARFNRAFAVEAQGFSEGAFCVLPERS